MNSRDLVNLALLYACVARVEGMKAANQASVANGFSGVYSEDHFKEEAQELTSLSELFSKAVEPNPNVIPPALDWGKIT